MNKILVEVSVGELLDKISILEIKKEKILDSESLNFIEKEYLILKEQLDKNIIYDEKLDKLFKSLKKINTTLWEYEDEKRSYEKNSDFGDNFIKVSREIHFLNDNRSKVKLDMNKTTGSLIREIKQYTSY
jgi:adenine C2-methylase RlmN of 23S rRNA A2503 and tRNA A37|tara:strand:+ start:482 stop:871 length:390 start_codon:yes stop_codon:yes gene_type:complete